MIPYSWDNKSEVNQKYNCSQMKEEGEDLVKNEPCNQS